MIARTQSAQTFGPWERFLRDYSMPAYCPPSTARRAKPRECAVIPVTAMIAVLLSLLAGRAEAQHLWWDVKGQDDATCLYGEITVLATHDGIYYCGANWHPGEPAGGYCGIQHNSPRERRTIFSIWDTSAELRPKVTEAEAKTIFNRFGGEGEGAHTHMPWNWRVGEPFWFFLRKQPASEPGATEARYYIYDRDQKAWRHSATIWSPNGDPRGTKSVANIGGGGLASFLENFAGKDRATPKLALYRRAGVPEYATALIEEERIEWRVLVEGSYCLMEPDAKGVFRSKVFPGLWVDSAAFWREDGSGLLATLDEGLRSEEHARFVEVLRTKSAP